MGKTRVPLVDGPLYVGDVNAIGRFRMKEKINIFQQVSELSNDESLKP